MQAVNARMFIESENIRAFKQVFKTNKLNDSALEVQRFLCGLKVRLQSFSRMNESFSLFDGWR